MLSAVAQEAAEAAQGGWYWRLKPLKAKVGCGRGGAGEGGGWWIDQWVVWFFCRVID